MPHMGPEYPANYGHDEEERTARSDAELYVKYWGGLMGMQNLVAAVGSPSAAQALIARPPTAAEYAQIQALRQEYGEAGLPPAPKPLPGAETRPPNPNEWTGNGPQGYGTYIMNPDGSLGRYVGDTRAPKEPGAERLPQGSISLAELQAAGAVQKAPGIMELNGIQFRRQPDGTYSYGSAIGSTGGAQFPAGYIDFDEAGQAWEYDGQGGRRRRPDKDKIPGAEGVNPTSQSSLNEVNVQERIAIAQAQGARVSQEGNDWVVTLPSGTQVRYVAGIKLDSSTPNALKGIRSYTPVTSVGGSPAQAQPTGGLTGVTSMGTAQQVTAAPSPPVQAPAASPPQGGLTQAEPDRLYVPEYGGFMERSTYDSIPENWNKPQPTPYANGTPKGGLVLNEQAYIIGESGRNYGVIGEPTAGQPLGQQEMVTSTANGVQIDPLRRPQAGETGVMGFADGGLVGFQNGGVYTPEQIAAFGQQLQTQNQAQPTGGLTGAGQYTSARIVSPQLPSGNPTLQGGMNTSPMLAQFRPLNYAPQMAYYGLAQADINATRPELQRQVAAQGGLIGAQRTDIAARRGEYAAMNAAQDDWQGNQNVALQQRAQDAMDPRYGAAGLNTPIEMLNPLNGTPGAAAPGTRYMLETAAQRLAREQGRAQEGRGLDIAGAQVNVSEANFAGGAPQMRDLGLRSAQLNASQAGFEQGEINRWSGVVGQEFTKLAMEDPDSIINRGGQVNTQALEYAIQAQDWKSVAQLLGVPISTVMAKVSGLQGGRFANGGTVTVKPRGGLVAA